MSDKQGLIVLKPGYTINDIDDPRSWAFNSNYPIVRIAKKGKDTLNGLNAQVIINHGLGYNPLNFLFTEDLTTAGEFHLATGNNASGFPFVRMNPGDPDNITVLDEFANNQDFFYYIFYIESTI